MSGDDDFMVRFWGVRGSVACPGPETVRYGGNTTCIEIRCGEALIIIDAGTGIRRLGLSLNEKGGPIDADFLFTHTHFDHVGGLPFFAPIFNPKNSFRLWAGHLTEEQPLDAVLCGMMMAPLFPVPIDVFQASTDFRDFNSGETLELKPGVTVRTAPLQHPSGATGYRVEYRGRSLCIVTDTEHPETGFDPHVIDLVRNSDFMVYDSTYTDDEYPRHRGWGHSTWQMACKIAEEADVGKAIIFHHDPQHDDDFMDRVAASAEHTRPGTLVAREGMVLSL